MKFLLFCTLIILCLGFGQTQNLSTYGSEFFIGFYEHVHAANTHTLYVHTRRTYPIAFSVTSLDGGFTYSGSATLNSPGVVSVPASYEVSDRSYSWRRKGLRVSSLATEPVSVVAWSYRGAADYMSYLALPCHTQPTTEYVYYAVSTKGWSNQPSQFLIVGCSNNSNVTIVPSNSITVPSYPQLSGSSNIVVAAGQSYTFTLHSMQTLFVFEPNVDLTGTKITSDKPLTIISGHEASRVPFGYSDADPIVTQLTPTITWGKNFLLAPHAGRLNGQGYKVIAAFANTTAVRTCNGSSVSLVFDSNRTSWFETGSNTYCNLVSSRPVYVAKIGLSHAYNGSRGDPCANTVPPIEQFETDSIQFTAFSVISDSYYSVVVPKDDNFNGSLIINGTIQTFNNWTSINNSAGNVVGYGYSAPVSGTTTIQHASPGGQLFVSAFGWTTYGGYCYVGGMKLNSLSSSSVAEVSFNASSYTVNEGAGSVTLSLERLVNLTTNMSVRVYVNPTPEDTASIGQDYSNVSIVVSFSSGQTAASVSIPIIDDSVVENSERFTVSIEVVSGVAVFPLSEAVVTIVDNDVSGNLSTYGSEFFIGFYEHVHAANTHTLYVHTRRTYPVAFSVTSLDGGFTYSGSATLNSPGVVSVPASYEVSDRSYSWRRKGLRVSSLATEPVSVLAWSYRGAADYMSYLALPCHTQPTTEYVYYAVSTKGWSDQPSQFLIVGCSNNSNVTIVPSNSITVPSYPQLSGSSNIVVTAGQSYTFTLHSMQTLFVFEPNVDLTGTKITSDKPLTIISGHEASRVPFGYSDADPIVTQLTPTITWGKNFLLAPHAGRLNGQGYKVIAAFPNTTAVRTCNGSSVSLVFDSNRTSWFETGSNTYCNLVSSRPVYVAKIGLSHAYNGSRGDPCANTVPPIEQYETDSIQFTAFSVISDSYYSVVVPKSGSFNGSLIINGTIQTFNNWTSINNSAGNVVGYGYSAPVSGTTTIQHASPGGQLFVSAFGWTTYGGYCYVGGMKLNSLSSSSVAEVSFNASSYTVNEGAGSVTLYLERLVNLTTNVSVRVYVNPTPEDTASVGQDYSNVSIVVNFSSGQTAASFSIPIIDDSVVENSERFTVSIEVVSGVAVFPLSEAVVTIVDNDVSGNLSTYGSEFFIGFYEHVHAANTHTLYVHTRRTYPVAFSVTSLDGGFTYSGSATLNSPGVVSVPASYEVSDRSYSWRRKGLRVSSLATEPVSVVAWSYRGAADYMSYLALPCHTQPTTEYVYYAVSTKGWSDQPSQFLIVGCSNNSNVTIVPSNSITVPSYPQLSGSSNIVVTAGQSYTFTLHSMQTLFVFEPNVDLTGTKITSDKPLTIISGHEASRVPFGYSDADPIVTQLTPTITWGKNFLLAPHAGRLNGQGYKVIAAFANTTAVRTCNGSSVSLVFDSNRTSWFETGSNTYCNLVSSRPVYVAKIGLSHAYNGSRGDPCANTVPPIEQFETDSIQFTAFSVISDSYYSVVVPKSGSFNGSLIINGTIQTFNNWASIYNSAGNVVGYGYSAPVSGTTTIQHASPGGQLFVSAFGWTTYGGYCYVGGMKLNSLSSSSVAEVSFNASSYTVNEGAGSVTLYLERLVNLTTNVSVRVYVNPTPEDTASVGQDYSNVSIVVNFSSGQTAASVSIPIIDDSVVENSERFTVSIEVVSGVAVFPLSEAVVTIVDNDVSGNLSTYGSEFFIGFYEHVHAANTHTLYVHTRRTYPVAFSVTSLDGGFTYSGSATLNSPGVVSVPASYEVSDRSYSWRRKGLRVSSLATEPVSVVAWSYRGAADYMSYLALPCHTQPTTEYVYYAVSTKGWSNQPSQFLIVGCSNNSNVTIVPSNSITVPSYPQLSGSSNIVIASGQTYTFTLHSMQTLFVFESNVDLTGTKITSDKPLTIISGHEASRVPFGYSDADPIVTQLTPTITWGKNFLLAPHAGRLNGQGYKVIAAFPNTTAVRTCNGSSVSLVFDSNRTSWFETGSNTYCNLVSSRPVYVAKIGLSHAYNGSRGDPCANTVPPIEQFETDSIQFTAFSVISDSYYSVVVPESGSFNGSLIINGTIQTFNNWASIYNSAGNVVGYGYSAPVSGTTTIQHASPGGQLFVSAFGWTTYGGYCYVGGMKLNSLSSSSVAEVSFNASSYTVNEGAGSVTLYLERLVNLTTNVSVRVYVNPTPEDTASIGQDYSNVSIVVNFSSGQTLASVSIPIMDDSLFENLERFTVSITAITGATVFPLSSAVISIVDNDGLCSINNGGCEHYCVDTVNSSYCECAPGYTLESDQHNCSLTPSCSISNGGCEQICTQLEGSVSCSCNSGFSVNNTFYCSDNDECSTNNGGCSQYCVNTYGSFRCDCYSGYVFDSELQICLDNNECALNKGGCEQICHNTNGSYYCSCNYSYAINSDGHHCDDVNECDLGIHGCSQICVNTNGSYTCVCNAGYHLMSNQKTCTDANECLLNNGGCSQLCTNTIGSYQCSCYAGYVLNSTDSCVDINECTNGTNLCEQTCYNTEGSYVCDCQPGYELSNNLTCSDINECLNNNGGCNQMCVNQVGSYYCQCNASYVLDEDGRGCSEAANDCAANPDACEHLCHTSNNSFYCTCYSGYRLASNGRTCDEIDECSEGLSRCNQQCRNTIGGYSCLCLNGFQLLSDNYTCQDINECLESNGGCEDSCTNTVGSYTCSCQASGYALSSDKHNCSDINECSSSNGGCNQQCVNTAGSYYCSCNPGYSLLLNGLTCRDIDECIDSECEHVCNNTDGSYTCSCNSGYSLDSNGRNCSDINECSNSNGGCEQVCLNEEPYFSCSCYNGFRLYNSKFCSDIDECYEGLSGCSQICKNTIGSYSCRCMTGYQLSSDNHTCTDIDECAASNGGCEQSCINTNGSKYCSCQSGYTLTENELNCTDINECNFYNGGCSQQCTNTQGSFYCGCNNGYNLADDTFNCTDINECQNDNGGCSHLCINTIGSYQCQCYDGHQPVDPNSMNCTDINECYTNNGGCEQECTNTNGSFQCSCYPGYFGSIFCSDINECDLGISGCNQTCINTVGSYYCGCQNGYYLSSDNHTCIDVNECSDGISNCDQVCINVEGSFLCDCNTGFLLDPNGINCRDINECETGTNNCQHTCLNNDGSFYCLCDPGFRLNYTTNATCDDIDECSEGISGCSYLCTNAVGSYTCSCQSGYELSSDNRTCIDTDECTNNNGGCQHICQNIDGSYTCLCLTGHELVGNNHNCADINECELDNGGCDQTCMNINGSFECSCSSGYTLRNNAQCIDIDECLQPAIYKCGHSCENIDGSYRCTCQSGYYLGSDNHTCFDVDECTRDNGGCEQICINKDGSFHCSCWVDYVLNNDNLTCRASGNSLNLASGQASAYIGIPAAIIITAVVCIIIAAIVLVVIRKRKNNTQRYPVDDYNMPQTPRLNPLYFANESESMNGDSKFDDEDYDEIVTSI